MCLWSSAPVHFEHQSWLPSAARALHGRLAALLMRTQQLQQGQANTPTCAGISPPPPTGTPPPVNTLSVPPPPRMPPPPFPPPPPSTVACNSAPCFSSCTTRLHRSRAAAELEACLTCLALSTAQQSTPRCPAKPRACSQGPSAQHLSLMLICTLRRLKLQCWALCVCQGPEQACRSLTAVHLPCQLARAMDGIRAGPGSQRGDLVSRRQPVQQGPEQGRPAVQQDDAGSCHLAADALCLPALPTTSGLQARAST